MDSRIINAMLGYFVVGSILNIFLIRVVYRRLEYRGAFWVMVAWQAFAVFTWPSRDAMEKILIFFSIDRWALWVYPVAIAYSSIRSLLAHRRKQTKESQLRARQETASAAIEREVMQLRAEKKMEGQ